MFADLLADYLATLQLGTPGSDLFVGFLPPTPPTATVIYVTPGLPPDSVSGYEQPGAQLVCRAPTADAAYARCAAALDALNGLRNATLSGTHVLLISALQSAPFGLGRDEADYHRYAVNLRGHLRRVSRHRQE